MTDKTKEPGTVHRQKARKEHYCAECPETIPKGCTYIYLNTFDEKSRRWSKYLLCAECERILNCYRIAALALDEDGAYSMGRLRADVKGLLVQGGFWKLEFNKAWKASEPAPVSEDA